ncbi:hypothetical protein H5410_017433 [Solanum commersonii]|uniref:Uncharacterized protein n=1 Tax=Solanum commersonii TaxID=4109 RepID=A0A9J5ZZA2_SOLCO|nr:hypothetical protein H5410_017433 [Solanum commersonii]
MKYSECGAGNDYRISNNLSEKLAFADIYHTDQQILSSKACQKITKEKGSMSNQNFCHEMKFIQGGLGGGAGRGECKKDVVGVFALCTQLSMSEVRWMQEASLCIHICLLAVVIPGGKGTVVFTSPSCCPALLGDDMPCDG